MEIALRNLSLKLRRGQVVGFQDARIPGQADSDKAGVAHHVENIGERRQGVVRPEAGAYGPFDIAVGRQAFGGARECGGERGQKSASLHHGQAILMIVENRAGGRGEVAPSWSGFPSCVSLSVAPWCGAARERLLYGYLSELERQGGSASKQDLVAEKAIAGIRQFVIPPVPETLSLLVKQRFLARIIDNRSSQSGIRHMPNELIYGVENGEFCLHWIAD